MLHKLDLEIIKAVLNIGNLSERRGKETFLSEKKKLEKTFLEINKEKIKNSGFCRL